MRRFDPEATGAIAGQSGKYVELLAAMLAEAHDWPPVALTEDWSSYAGDARRSGIAPSDVSAVTAFWHRDLPPVNLAATEQPRPMPVYFPVIVDEKVYVGDARHVWGFHLRDGSSLVKVIESGQLFAAPLPADRPQRAPSLAFTLHSDREQLLARLGPPPGNLPERTTEPDYGFFTSLDLQTFKLVWKAESTSLEFEGTPVCDRQRMYALAREAEGEDSVSLHVVCRELSDGRARWRSWICRNKQREFLNRLPPALLTLAEDTLYACTNLGCVAAIGTSDGRLRWALEYPRAMRPNPRGEGSLPPAPNPCLFHQGMVIAAPADAEQLLAIDAATGELLWTAPRSGWGSDHLLGVAHGNLIVGGDALRWIDVKNGLLRGRFPLAEFDEPGMSRPGPRGYGRGLLAGERVYWPTPEWIYVFEQAIADSRRGPSIVSAGQIDLRRMNVESGNLAASHGVLLIASPSRLAALGNPPAP
jgi:outer membrane protein assembly factor BamB